ncbi:HAD family hydrolase [Sulfitobacter sp. D35]|uniref:sulfotransferase-like domain-containing protein n=1 Tax=Sulfitobacter sp. D35 TaxID=3083252 RepID=UPI00296EB071|nr:HAD family hydrolase [Sulfitobacter sp. D35]MDW4498059.1 HAD family hydrolase [Sulfitobacter sp. D35]
MRIAMWSGPRNLSTAMMYSFGARDDFHVMDEPFYGAYLIETGLDHPMRDEILAVHETDARSVAEVCGVELADRPHLYMKHMAHHMLDGFPLGWAEGCVNVHLIRHPARVIASYAAKREAPDLRDIGFEQQTALFDRLGGIVVDSDDIRADPEAMLRLLCDRIGLRFDAAMLCWPAGTRSADGVWAAHWYGAVHQSTGFAGAEGPLPDLSGREAELSAEALPYYEALWNRRLH